MIWMCLGINNCVLLCSVFGDAVQFQVGEASGNSSLVNHAGASKIKGSFTPRESEPEKRM